MELYKNIKRRRQQLNMSQDELARRLGYKSRSTIAKIESGENDISQKRIKAFADALHTTPSHLMGWEETDEKSRDKKGVRIPVLGKVAAGIPLEAIEDVEDFEEITEVMASSGDYFALRIQGSSMEPRISEGDVVIVKKQETLDSGEIGVVIVNGQDATVKKVVKQDDGILLISNNQVEYPPHFYSQQDVEELPVHVLGKVVELRAKF